MNKQEFTEMRKEFGDYVYRYEYFLKSTVINDYYYNNLFKTSLDQVRVLEVENILYNQALKMIKENASKEDIETMLNRNQEEFNKEKVLIVNKHKKALEIVNHNNSMPMNEKEQLEKDFLEFVRQYHPLVNAHATEESSKAYNLIRAAYFENNTALFNELINANKDLFKEEEPEATEYNKISLFYYNQKKGINADWMKKANSYPNNKAEVFKDEITIARETGDLKTRINQLKRANMEMFSNIKDSTGIEFTLN